MIWNYGKTPAVINKIQGIVSLEQPVIPKIEDIENPPGIFLGSDHWVRIPAASKKINEHERQNIFQNNIAAYCCGRIEYQDVFGGDHTMGFCWELKRIDIVPGQKWVVSGKYKQLNYHT
jgi:hypothetical protein